MTPAFCVRPPHLRRRDPSPALIGPGCSQIEMDARSLAQVPLCASPPLAQSLFRLRAPLLFLNLELNLTHYLHSCKMERNPVAIREKRKKEKREGEISENREQQKRLRRSRASAPPKRGA